MAPCLDDLPLSTAQRTGPRPDCILYSHHMSKRPLTLTFSMFPRPHAKIPRWLELAKEPVVTGIIDILNVDRCSLSLTRGPRRASQVRNPTARVSKKQRHPDAPESSATWVKYFISSSHASGTSVAGVSPIRRERFDRCTAPF